MTEQSKTFADLGVAPDICRALEASGITNPFPIQELTLPLALSRADVIGQARTGTGKTLAFGIPLLQAIDLRQRGTQALVIVPTRELCLQVHNDIATAGEPRGVSTAALYGGKAIEAQSGALDAGAQVVVGTPGRLLDLRRRGVLDLAGVATLVLDEADEMLDMGFLPDVEQLIQACGSDRQTLLFSATMPSEVVGLARRYMNKPTFMRADVEEPQIAPETHQIFLACHRLDKPAVLARILRTPKRGLCVVFTRTKRMADILVTELADHGVIASAIHSNLRQDARERTLDRFRRGKVDVLCATEVAARGLDISDVTHVVNYDCPDDEKMYLHRIGRTGRAGAAGVAVTLVLWNEQARLEMIKKALDIDAPTHEVFSTSPELDELFDLAPREASEPAATVPAPRESRPSQPSGSSPRGGSGRPRRSTRRRERTGGGAAERGISKPTAQRAEGQDRQSMPAQASRPAAQAKRAARSEPAAADQPEGQERRRVRRRAGASDRKPTPEAAARVEQEQQSQPPEPVERAERRGPPEQVESEHVERADTQADAGDGEASEQRRVSSRAHANRARSGQEEPSGPPRKRRRGGADHAATGPRAQERPAPQQHDEGRAPRDPVPARGEGQPALNRPMKISHLP